jgi:hypothetical protein
MPPSSPERPAMTKTNPPAVVVPRELFDFLMGAGDIDGTSFGDMHGTLPGRFWWRALLRTAEQSTHAEPAEPVDNRPYPRVTPMWAECDPSHPRDCECHDCWIAKENRT